MNGFNGIRQILMRFGLENNEKFIAIPYAIEKDQINFYPPDEYVSLLNKLS